MLEALMLAGALAAAIVIFCTIVGIVALAVELCRSGE